MYIYAIGKYTAKLMVVGIHITLNTFTHFMNFKMVTRLILERKLEDDSIYAQMLCVCAH